MMRHHSVIKINHFYLLSSSILIVYYLIGFAGLIHEPYHIRSLQLMNSGSERSYSETAVIESLEACFWLAALVLYLLSLKKRIFQGRPFLWILFFCAFSLVALGEETSWGQNIFGYSPPSSYAEFNNQGEINVHNLDLAKVFALSKGSFFYALLDNPVRLLNLIFYLLCVTVWLILPVTLKRTDLLKNFRLFRNFPSQNPAFYWIFSAFTVVYLLVDWFLFDAGELYELTLATAGFLTAVNQYQFASNFNS